MGGYSQNLALVAGRLGRDPEIKTSKDGKPIAKFSIATETGWGNNKKTNWLNIVCFGKTAEYVEKYIQKGDLVAATGRIDIDDYEKKDGSKSVWVSIVADSVNGIVVKGGKNGGSEKSQTADIPEVNPPSSNFDDSDFPF